MPQVHPEVLRWARESAGIDTVEAARKLATTVDRLSAYEAGDREPSRSLLGRMAKAYRRPLVALYLSSPPPKGRRGQDFRTLPGHGGNADEAVLDVLLRELLARQSLLRAALEEEDEPEALDFVASMRLEDGLDAVLKKLRELLGVTIGRYREQRTPDAGFRLLRQAAEDAGVFVLLASDLGSHHTSLDVETFRGFAIADPVAPFVVINNLDARAAWTFTLLHELVHVLLGNTGVSGTDLARDVERFCDAVAAEYLLPRSELRAFALGPVKTTEDLAARISRFADERHVSRSMVAVGLWAEHMISREQRSALMALFRRQWRESRVADREAAGEGGPDYFVVRRHRLGNALVDTTARLLHNGVLSRTKAGWLLGVKPFHVDRLTSAPLARAPRPA